MQLFSSALHPSPSAASFRSADHRPLRILKSWLPLALLVAAIGCQPTAAPETGPQPSTPAAPPAPERLGGEIVRLDPAEAAELVADVHENVPVQLADGLSLSLWAPEPLLEDPIAISVDRHGHVYLTGSERTIGLLDIRGHPTWHIPALALRSVEEFRAFLRRELAPERSEQNARWLPDLNEDGSHDWRDLTVARDKVIRLVDTTGDGIADLSQVMYAGFNEDELADVSGGLLVHDGRLFVGIAPDLWVLRDTTGDGVLDVKESFSRGYGVHPGFNGHGISGVTVGPDGRIYWAVGDMGFNVVDREGRRWEYPAEGAILRADPDGSGFEVFATGLRNTHEFVFDELGNLIGVDNDGDYPGEHERVVYLVDGSDSGWRVNWQFGKYTDPDNNRYNVWMDEGLFRPRFEGQAAYILPPVSALNVGPAGMAYNPGTALGERWRNHFFVAAFHGSPTNSRIHAFRLRPSGAGFELAEDSVIVRGILPTGMDFGPDGALYVADWVEGWRTTGTGRIWKLDVPAEAESPGRTETRALLDEGFAHRSDRELAQLLRHADMRVRQGAQFALADRSADRVLLSAARQREHRLARVHGIWGIGQLARRDLRQAAGLVALLRDADDEVRAQAARVLGDVRYAPAADALVPLLRGAAPRARFFAAEALGRIGHQPAIPALISMLEENDDADVYLRHAGSLALARIGEVDPVAALAEHPSRAVRIAAVVALRRMASPAVARFLGDADAYVATEAARAINDDGGIEEAIPDLARLLERPSMSAEPLLRRAINANQRLATTEAARRLAAFAKGANAPDAMRVEALNTLAVWPNPSLVDRVDGVHHGEAPAVARDAERPIRALYVTGGGFHDFVAQESIVPPGIASRIPIEWTIDNTAGTATDALIPRHQNANWADEFDVVVYNMSFSFVVDPEWIERIAQAHRDRGVGAVLLHGAVHSYRRSTTDAWRELKGAASYRHDSQREFSIEWLQPGHPITRGLPEGWGPGVDELYEIEKVWPTFTPLARAWSVESERHHPVVWTNTYGNARVFATTMGHNNETMADPVYLDLVTRGLLWTVGRLEDDGATTSGSAPGAPRGWRADPENVERATRGRPEFNYHENRVPQYELPDPLRRRDGSIVRSADEWAPRRGEILELFREHVYGRMPGRPEELRFVILEEDPRALEGAATFRRIAVDSRHEGREHRFELALFIPNGRQRPAPAFVLLDNRFESTAEAMRRERTGFWPVEDVVARGYAIAAIRNNEVTPDNQDHFREGIIRLFEGEGTGPRAPDAWGALAAWAWGASRAMDYFEADPDVDARRVAVIGHSRGGKAALWAGAEDERFALVISNESGAGGAALSRRRYGETVARITTAFPHWFASNFSAYGGREDEIPVDQHMLLALQAPRAVYVASADADLWADPRGEFLSLAHASRVFAIWGDPSIAPPDMPPVNESLVVGRRGYHIRSGTHDLTSYDWARYLDFADRLWRE